jgi:1,4-alpha-glucan branching enzyme
MKEIIITKFDYELGDEKQRWSAYIAAQSIEEATKFLMKTVPGAQINQRSSGFRLDALSDEVRNAFAHPYIKTINDLKEQVNMLKSTKNKDNNDEINQLKKENELLKEKLVNLSGIEKEEKSVKKKTTTKKK